MTKPSKTGCSEPPIGSRNRTRVVNHGVRSMIGGGNDRSSTGPQESMFMQPIATIGNLEQAYLVRRAGAARALPARLLGRLIGPWA